MMAILLLALLTLFLVSEKGCTAHQRHIKYDEEVSSRERRGILTRWCGPGDSAEGSHDLGMAADTDACCRAHDRCQPTIRPGETKWGLTNRGRFTMKHCNCDHRFKDCLRRVNKAVYNQVVRFFFWASRVKCFVFKWGEAIATDN